MSEVLADSRAKEAAIFSEVGEEMHRCGFCGTRTEVDVDRMAGPSWEEPRVCPHCRQAYYLTDEEAEGGIEPGEIEIVDESSGKVVGMTSDDRATRATANLRKRLDKLYAEENTPIADASESDLDHLFGKKRRLEEPSPYGDEFGSY